ncbi:hypothetical protein [Blastococcus mobilis]|uniref:hypothetical protein n=1 Tax=Blastococcus mobilis TaxID=1938746 RepID=UPI001596306A|nr:hypothetical protein [Blastococcus mobilis]
MKLVEVDYLPHGRRADWHQHLNLVTVLRSLSPAERAQALADLQAEAGRELGGLLLPVA